MRLHAMQTANARTCVSGQPICGPFVSQPSRNHRLNQRHAGGPVGFGGGGMIGDEACAVCINVWGGPPPPLGLPHMHRMNALTPVRVSDAADASDCASTTSPPMPPERPDKFVATVAVPASSRTIAPMVSNW